MAENRANVNDREIAAHKTIVARYKAVRDCVACVSLASILVFCFATLSAVELSFDFVFCLPLSVSH